ncbi:myb/SANT-like DNA-binding domain-containing protein 4 [Polypterus senegalus]|uniref:myb/SANT-like DNA-binding domain-containing protein 4 n=1 Tax=Polypterus senegalus TaxID=55291 RepID=UPI00196267DF|nr:myb/SANT-like DNA-binding domain-containing protein 4 [Polypterus senegalus]
MSFCRSGTRSSSALRFKKRKSRFSHREIQVLLEEVSRNRHIVIGKFNRGVASELKKRTWAEITARINGVSHCPREIIEVIKKWSDLKCDTKRKVAVMRAGSSMIGDLTPVETAVHQILELASKRRTQSEDVVSSRVSDRVALDAIRSDAIKQEESTELPTTSTAPTAEWKNVSIDLPSKRELATPTHVYCVTSQQESSSSPFEVQYEIRTVDDQPLDSDSIQDLKEECQTHFPDTMQTLTEEDVLHGTGQRRGVTSPNPASIHQTLSMREKLVQNASLSVREQRTSNELLETISRSLELLSESMQQMVETHQDFIRDTLQLQRESMHILREFTSGALALMHEKLNGRPLQP